MGGSGRRKRNFVKVGTIKIPWTKFDDGRTCIDLRSLGLKRRTFVDHAEAVQEAERIARERHNGGAELVAFSANDRAVYAQLCEGARLFALDPPAAITEWREARRQMNGSKHSLAELVRAGVDALKRPPHPTGDVVLEILGTIKGKHKSYERGLRLNFLEFAKQHPGDIAEITATQIETYLNNWVELFKVGARRRNNLLRELRQLFQFAKIRGYVPDKVTEARKVGIIKRVRTRIEIVSVELMQLFLDYVSDYWRPWMWLAGFSGIRTDEIVLSRDAADWKDALKWEDFDWPNREICVRPETSKTGIARRVPILDNLYEALRPYIGRKGYVCPPIVHQFGPRKGKPKQLRPDRERVRILALLRKLEGKEKPCDADGNPILLEYPDNGFRHAYISNRLPIVKSMAAVAMECGTSESRIKANYNSPQPLSRARRYFAIYPTDSADNQIQFVLR